MEVYAQLYSFAMNAWHCITITFIQVSFIYKKDSWHTLPRKRFRGFLGF